MNLSSLKFANISKSAIWRSLAILESNERKKILFMTFLQIFIGLLDLVGVIAFGLLGSLAIRGIQSQPPGDKVSLVLHFLRLDSVSVQKQVLIVGVLASITLVSRTIITMIINRRILYFLSRYSAILSSRLIAKILSWDLLTIQRKSTQEINYAVTGGVQSITLGIIANCASMVSDTSILILLTFGLFVLDPVSAFATFSLFAGVAGAIYILVNKRAHFLGATSVDLTIVSSEKIFEVLNSYREASVRNRKSYYAKLIGQSRMNIANINAELAFIPSVTKYLIEITLVLGALSISAIQFAFKDASHAIATLAVFLAASSRIAPAVLRLQNGALTVRSNLGIADSTMKLIEENRYNFNLIENPKLPNFSYPEIKPDLVCENISFTYPNKNIPAVSNANFTIPAGNFAAIVGPSGAGKTTLADLLLGLLDPQSGQVKIANQDIKSLIKDSPGSISYVPQDILIVKGSIRENVAMGFPNDIATDDLIYNALNTAQLIDVVKELPLGIDTQVGERGTKLSGGQRQRLGIARAVFTNPKLIILDEATSALDGQTESDVTKALHTLKGKTTVIMIAHRLATVRNADIVIYMDSGKIIDIGTFDEVRNRVPDFDKQAQLMGL